MIHNPGAIDVTLDISDVILTCSSNVIEVVPTSVNISPDCPSATTIIQVSQVYDVLNSLVMNEPNFVEVSPTDLSALNVQITDLADNACGSLAHRYYHAPPEGA